MTYRFYDKSSSKDANIDRHMRKFHTLNDPSYSDFPMIYGLGTDSQTMNVSIMSAEIL